MLEISLTYLMMMYFNPALCSYDPLILRKIFPAQNLYVLLWRMLTQAMSAAQFSCVYLHIKICSICFIQTEVLATFLTDNT